MKKQLLALFIAGSACWAQAVPLYPVEQTTSATLLADLAVRADLDKHIPEISGNPQISMADGFTLVFVSSIDQGDELSEENLKTIDRVLATLGDSETGE